MLGWLDEISYLSAHVVAITHPTIIRLATLHELAAFWRVEVEQLPLTHLHFSRGRWSLLIAATGLDIPR